MKRFATPLRFGLILLILVMAAGFWVKLARWHESLPLTRAKRQLCRLAEAYRDVNNPSAGLKEFADFANARDPKAMVSLVDPWGTPLAYSSKGGIITSAGPDKGFGTPDDLSIVAYNYEYPRASGTGRIPLSAVTSPVEEVRHAANAWRFAGLLQSAVLLSIAAAFWIRKWKRARLSGEPRIMKSFAWYLLAVCVLTVFASMADLAAVYEFITIRTWYALMPIAGPPLLLPLVSMETGTADLLPVSTPWSPMTVSVIFACCLTYYAVILSPVFGMRPNSSDQHPKRTHVFVIVVVAFTATVLALMAIALEASYPIMHYLR